MSASIWNPQGTQPVPALPAITPVTFVKGTVSNPGLNFVSDGDTGIWSQADGYINFAVNGINVLTIDPQGNVSGKKFFSAPEVDIISAATCDIGSLLSNSARITGTNSISSFGTNYKGPMFIRFAGALTLANSANLICPGGASINVLAGDTCIAIPKASAGVSDGWVITSYQSSAPLLNSIAAINGGQIAGMRNRIINGDMRVDQRNAGAAITTDATAKFAVDRFQQTNAAGNGVVTAQQSTLSGAKSLKVTATSATTDLSASKFVYGVCHRIESQNIYDLNGQFATISFKVQTNWSGNLSVAIDNGTRSYVIDKPVIPGINLISVTIQLEASTVITNDNTKGLELNIGFNNEGNYKTTVVGTWQTLTNQGLTSTASTQWTKIQGNFINVTDLQLELGSVATVFERRPYGMELGLCHRYFQITSPAIDVVSAIVANYSYSYALKVDMRTAPTLVVSNIAQLNTQTTNADNLPLNQSNCYRFRIYTSVGGNASAFSAATVTASAEL